MSDCHDPEPHGGHYYPGGVVRRDWHGDVHEWLWCPGLIIHEKGIE